MSEQDKKKPLELADIYGKYGLPIKIDEWVGDIAAHVNRVEARYSRFNDLAVKANTEGDAETQSLALKIMEICQIGEKEVADLRELLSHTIKQIIAIKIDQNVYNNEDLGTMEDDEDFIPKILH